MPPSSMQVGTMISAAAAATYDPIELPVGTSPVGLAHQFAHRLTTDDCDGVSCALRSIALSSWNALTRDVIDMRVPRDRLRDIWQADNELDDILI